MIKLLIVTNLVCLVGLLFAAGTIYATHEEFATTKNRHLLNEKMLEIESESDINILKLEIAESLKNITTITNTYNQRIRYSSYLLFFSCIMLLVNAVVLIQIRVKYARAT